MAEERPRPSPDELLARVKAEQEQEKRGKLKVFLGYAPGVGKTYAMLEDARRRRKDTDVVIAVVETHHRAETESLLEGFEIVPRRQVEYRGIKLGEMDIDAVLARRPQLAVVDELAHENAPGSRHPKRYQDVEELLQAGIDVYTTVNVQHIESGRTIVAQVTGVWVHETVPDSVIDNANEIEMADLPPDGLLARLKEGKVYVPEQIAAATERFFRKGNLTALRELAMRTAAKHIDEETLAYMKAHGITGPWPSGERILLYIGPGSFGSNLVRRARRLAYELAASWSALYVETPGSARFSTEQQDQIMDSMRLAQRLGAKAVTLQGDSVAKTVTDYAKANNITKIIMSKPSGNLWQRLNSLSIANQIVRRSENADVHLVSGGGDTARRGRRERAEGLGGNGRGYLQSIGLVALATVIGKLVPGFFDPTNMIMVYLLCVVITAFLWGYGPSILVSILGVLAFDFLFVHRFFNISLRDTKYILTFMVLLGVGLAISYLMRRIHEHTEVVIRHERQTAALYALGRDLATSNDLESYIHAITRRVKDTFGREAVVFLPEAHEKETLRPHTDNPDIALSENELAAAIWSYEHRRMAGPGTDTLPNAAYRYVPLTTPRGIVGILALSAAGGEVELTIEQEQLLEAYADLAAIAIESMILSDAKRNSEASPSEVKPQA